MPQTGVHVPATDDGRFKDAAALLASPINTVSAFSEDITTGRLLGLTTPMPLGSKSQFRTASLRNIAQTAPYMHAGPLTTLSDVVSFYNAGGGVPATGTLKDSRLLPLGLSASEQLDLVAFLSTLSGGSISGALSRFRCGRTLPERLTVLNRQAAKSAKRVRFVGSLLCAPLRY